MIKQFTLMLILGLTLGFTGCPRYEKVREISEEQLKVQEGLQNNLKAYITSMEGLADNHVIVSKLYYDDLAAQDKKRFEGKAKRDLDKLSTDKIAERAAISEQLGSKRQAIDDQNEKDKKELDDLVDALKKKDVQLLVAFKAMVEAQTQLNEYIKLKKFDEVLIEQVLGKLKISQQATLHLFDEAAAISSRIKPKQPDASKSAETVPNQ